jgi:hypothetical protein
MYDELTIKRKRTEAVVDLKSFDAEYCAFGRVHMREGSDVIAFQAAKSYCAWAIRAWENGETFHGHPYVASPGTTAVSSPYTMQK